MRALAREVAFKKIYESMFISNQDDLDELFPSLVRSNH